MPSIKVPEPHRAIIQTIFDMSDKDADKLLEAIENTPPALSVDAFASRVAANQEKLAASEVRRIVNTLATLHRIQQRVSESKSIFIEDILDDLRRGDKDRDKSKERLSRFLNQKSLQIASKATDVLTSHEHIFCNAQIMTEIRPVFSEDADVLPVAAVLVQMLRLGYHQDGEHKEFFIALDTSDIKTLRDTLDRADKKAQQAVRILDERVEYLDVEKQG